MVFLKISFKILVDKKSIFEDNKIFSIMIMVVVI